MKRFIYYIFDKSGKKKIGFLNKENREEAEIFLRENKFFIIKIFEINVYKKEISTELLLDFFIKLKFFVKNGYQFYRAIDFLEENTKFLDYTSRIKKSIRAGQKLTEIFRNSKLPLKEIDFALLKTGEESGDVYNIFSGIEERLREELERERRIKKIMLYPKIVICIIVILLFFLGKFILPNFVEIIGKENTALTTKSIIFFSENIQWVFFIFIFFLINFRYLKKNKKANELFFKYLMKIKLFRLMLENNFIIYFSKMLSIFLDAGITIGNGVEIIKNSITNIYFKDKLTKVKELLIKGEDIHKAIEEMQIFKSSEMEFIKTGEETGELSEIFNILSLRRKEITLEKTEKYLKLLEPITIVVIGIVVGIIFIGVYSPILNLMDSI